METSQYHQRERWDHERLAQMTQYHVRSARTNELTNLASLSHLLMQVVLTRLCC